MSFPDFFSEFDIIEYYDNNLSDPKKAYAIAKLSKYYTNQQIRSSLAIKTASTVSYYKRAGLVLSLDELTLWDRNTHKITLGHVRAILNYNLSKRDRILRDILAKGLSVRRVEAIAKQVPSSTNADIEKYAAQMSECLGCSVNIDYNPNKQSGVLSVSFFSLDDLTDKAESLGYTPESH